jgi:hypothetical protein
MAVIDRMAHTNSCSAILTLIRAVRNRNLVTPQNCRDSVPRAGAPIFRHVPLGRHIFFGTSYFALQQLFTLNHVSTSGFSCIANQAW